MPDDRSVLDHLLEGRDALQREVDRLTAAIEQLDSVLGRIGTTVARSDTSAPILAAADRQPATTTGSPVATPEPVSGLTQPVIAEAPAGPEPVTVPSQPRSARTVPARKPARARRAVAPAEPPKSIRVHVLEMLQAENREFGLAEIIDRVHAAGIQAHDDAVRSITIKLMKDGRVERVGRGQYRLARRSSSTRAPAPAAESTTYPTYAAPEPVEQPTPDVDLDPRADTEPDTPAAEPVDETEPADIEPVETEPVETEPVETEPVEIASSGRAETEPAPADDTPGGRNAYAPSLNLGQPWNN